MATQNQSLDSVITVKVNYDGSTRRAKMALRDTAPKVLEQEIRNFLHIPAETAIILERYSDSAASYVLLEPHNAAVYKQLYRAAKAKSKLKLRVSLKPRETPAAPKPVSIEDILEAAPPQMNTKPLVPAPTSESAPSTLSRTYDFNTLARAAKICESDMLRQSFDSSENAPAIKDDSPPPYAQGWPQLAPVFAICCNSCEKTTPMIHYHCSTCDDGDFDLCEDCVAKGISCYGSDHWMVKRTRVNGQIVNSTTERIAPKPKSTQPEPKKEEMASQGMSPPAPERKSHFSPTTFDAKSALASLQENLAKLEIQTAARVGRVSMRTCNQCIQELPEADFLHCDACEDYDLCRECFSKDSHGHHPQHAFSPAVSGATFSASVNSKLAPGRNKVHNAICDNCDKYITGIRHKCLDCPDWDYCADCVPSAVTTHPGHRFVPVYGALKSNYNFLPAAQHVHVGICCDGPLCSNSKSYPAYIRGVRYKCAVCHDLDFCASCEANPTNTHNKTHPLIKFNMPVRHVSVTTHGEGANGQQMPVMGDHIQRAPEAAQPAPQSPSKLSAPRTVVDTKPQPPSPKISLSAGFEKEQQKKNLDERHDSCQDMRATFLRDTVQDGTIVSPDQVFEQTWVLRNDGRDTWPAGCAVRFVGGDYMGSMSSKNAAASKDLVKASMTNSTTKPVGPGEEMAFAVKLRAPPRPGKTISFWRLATPSGHMFGHRLWCEIKVRTMPPATSPAPAAPLEEEAKSEQKSEDIQESEEDREVRKALDGPKVNSSQMIFPKLEKESPEASIHQESMATPSQTDEKSVVEDDFEDCSKETEWDGSDDDFLTDEEYDILDASDEEFLEEQTKKTSS